MRIQVAKWGNSTAVRLPKAVVEQLGLKPGAEVELTLNGREATLKAVERLSGSALLEKLLAEADRIGWENQPPLDDWSTVETPWPEYKADKSSS